MPDVLISFLELKRGGGEGVVFTEERVLAKDGVLTSFLSYHSSVQKERGRKVNHEQMILMYSEGAVIEDGIGDLV